MDTENQEDSQWKEDPGDPGGPKIPDLKQLPETAGNALPTNKENEINLKPEDMAQMASKMVLVRTNTSELIRDNRMLFDNATELLQYVKKEFHPAEE